MIPLLSPSWPRAIVHMDGDAFFASCEQAVNPAYRGKPLVTGKERNIVAAASYEAKALGIQRGVALWEAKKMCPELIVLPSDYETYSLFSKRMFDILRRYTPVVEEYSIDEAFAEVTGLRRLHHASYRIIADRMQADVHRELGISVSVGLSITKTLAKVSAKKRKPAGLTVVSGRDIESVLDGLPVEKIWNIGPNTAALLKQHGLPTALDFARASEETVQRLLTKPGIAVWHELNGRVAYQVEPVARSTYQSISKMKTFTPPSSNRDTVFAHLVKNVENACIKARRHHLAPQRITVSLRRQDFRSKGIEGSLNRPTAYPLELMPAIRELFSRVFAPGALYRATGAALTDLTSAYPLQLSLFDDPLRLTKVSGLYEAVDALRERYGKHVVHQGASLPAQKTPHLTTRGDAPARRSRLLLGETKRRRLPLPLLQMHR